MSNTFGRRFTVTTYGESHGAGGLGGVIDGCPAGINLDLGKIQDALDRRKPGQSHLTSSRKEDDKFKILSGVFEGLTTGTPIGFHINNRDQVKSDYELISQLFRPSHADFTYFSKYGVYDPNGGGRASARTTACLVLAGAIAQQALSKVLDGIKVTAYVRSVGPIVMPPSFDLSEINSSKVDKSVVRCPDPDTSKLMVKFIEEVLLRGDSVGGVIACHIRGVPAGLGQPLFAKLSASLAHAMFSINAVKGFELGEGFAGSQKMLGSEHNDQLALDDNNKVKTLSNHAGGILGGISNGEEIYFKVAFKPTATVTKVQRTVNRKMQPQDFSGTGRHDPCVLPRAVPIVEAMSYLVLIDQYLLNLGSKI